MIDSPSVHEPPEGEFAMPGALVYEHVEETPARFRDYCRALATMMGRAKSRNQRTWIDTFLSVPPVGTFSGLITCHVERELDRGRPDT